MPNNIDKNNIPRHLAVILDGNRRFARKRGMPPWVGHEYGAKKMREFLEWCRDIGIKELTLFCFSTENFKRPKIEVDALMKIFKKEFTATLRDKEIEKHKININFIGRLDTFPKDIQELMRKNMERTKGYSSYKINFAMAYSGRGELVDSVKNIAKHIKNGAISQEKIDENVIAANLYLNSEPDLIIRPSESRLSNFLLWQCAYSELIFLPDITWPEMTKEKLLECIAEYQKRERRFGR